METERRSFDTSDLAAGCLSLINCSGVGEKTLRNPEIGIVVNSPVVVTKVVITLLSVLRD